MAVLNQLNLKEAGISSDVAFIKSLIAREFWAWFELHKEDKIISIGIWFLRKTVRVRDIRSVFELLFGAQ